MSAKRGTQYGIRWPTGSVFAFPSRDAAERVPGPLMPASWACWWFTSTSRGTAEATEWREVPAAAGRTASDGSRAVTER